MKEGPVVTDVPRPVCVKRGNRACPASLTHFFGERALRQIFFLPGSTTLLRLDRLALFCSIRCPDDVILKTLYLIRAIREADIHVIGGFHTPMERDCLDILPRGTQPVVICPARSLKRIRLSTSIREGLLSGRVRLLSAFGPGCWRAPAESADQQSQPTSETGWWQLWRVGLASHMRRRYFPESRFPDFTPAGTYRKHNPHRHQGASVCLYLLYLCQMHPRHGWMTY